MVNSFPIAIWSNRFSVRKFSSGKTLRCPVVKSEKKTLKYFSFSLQFARLVLFCRMSTFCISDINCVEVLTSRVSQETYGKENLFFFFNAY